MSSEKLPKVLVDRLDTFISNVLDTVHITLAAALELARYPATLALYKAVDEYKSSGEKAEYSAATKRAEHFLPFVEKESARDFSFLHGMATIAIWSALEAFVDDYLLAAIECFPSFARTQAVGRIKIEIGEYEAMTDHDKRRYVVESLKSDIAASLKPGVGRFESILDRFDLGGVVGDELRACLLEFSSVRNVLVHRNGFADKRLVDQCPWMELKLGDSVNVNRKMLDSYSTGALVYGANVHRRMLLKCGCNIAAIDRFMMSLEPSAIRTIPSMRN